MNLQSRLQRTSGDSYTLERELGGGGMARVFAAASTERFRRAIRFATSPQQAHVVPVHSAGDLDGVPCQTMPFIEGEGLRARLAKAFAVCFVLFWYEVPRVPPRRGIVFQV